MAQHSRTSLGAADIDFVAVKRHYHTKTLETSEVRFSVGHSITLFPPPQRIKIDNESFVFFRRDRPDRLGVGGRAEIVIESPGSQKAEDAKKPCGAP